MKRQLTPSDVKFVWKETCKHYGTKALPVRSILTRIFNNRVLRTVKNNVSVIGTTMTDLFLADRYITQRIGRKTFILTPKFIGSDDDLAYQIAVCAHEHEHHLQYLQQGCLKFDADYLTNKTSRAVYEARAEVAESEVYALIGYQVQTGPQIFTKKWADVYKLDGEQRTTAIDVYNTAIKPLIRHDVVTTDPAQYIRSLLVERGLI